MLATMPDLNWRVIVKPWTWIYSFSRLGTVTWRDPNTGMNGKGTWKFEPGRMITTWANSKTWEEWDAPNQYNRGDRQGPHVGWDRLATSERCR